MADTINELYLKYIDAFSSLEDDRYFRYLFEIIQAGENVLQQNRQILHKVVDETWLTMIEDTLDALNTITEKPRRFVSTTEEVVPVALAKKIMAQSVRHLSMNTQFIASTENGDIQPIRVLNITQEDSYDLYENRFIYHLIQKLVVFIDKRTDVIFWSTGDEIRNSMVLESKIDDAYEEIQYRLEMKVTNRQTIAENDSDNMDVFMRIDRVRRMTMALRNSAFCELMAGCAKVRSPIQRTNLLMKDPNYRKCYQLWQFLENYDDVGYTIEEQNSALEFDEEYLTQMYINLISNYAVFKSLSEEGGDRNLDELEKTFHQVLKPKFVKEIHEEIVDDYNIPEVEVRKVIIEEVTQAQLDAEAKLAEETALREQAEAARDKAETEMQQTMIRSQQFMQQMLDAQEQAEIAGNMLTAAENAAALANTAREEAERAKAEAEQREAEALSARDAAEQALLSAKEKQTEAESARMLAESRAAETDRLRSIAESARDAALSEKESALAVQSEMKTAVESTAAALAEAQARAQEAAQAQLDAERRQNAAEQIAEEKSRECDAALEAQKSAEIQAIQEREARALAEQERTAALEKQQEADAALARAKESVAVAREQAASDRAERERMEAKLQAALTALEDAEKARKTAEQALQEAEKRTEEHRTARVSAETAMQDAQQLREAAERVAAESAKREKLLQDDLAKCEKKLEKTKKKLDSVHPWLRIFGGRK